MQCRRFGRLTNAYSKTLPNHAAAVSLHIAFYNFCRVHESLRTMTMHDDHHITDAEDAAFDATMKMVGVGLVLVMIAGMELGYFYL
jgi:hypothetical protein